MIRILCMLGIHKFEYYGYEGDHRKCLKCGKHEHNWR